MSLAFIVAALIHPTSLFASQPSGFTGTPAECRVTKVEVVGEDIILHGFSARSEFFEKLKMDMPKLTLEGGGVSMEGNLYRAEAKDAIISAAIPRGQSAQSIKKVEITLENLRSKNSVAGSETTETLDCTIVRVSGTNDDIKVSKSGSTTKKPGTK